MSDLRPLRERVTAGLRGDIVEIGFGSGLNLPYLPSAVTSVVAVEPSATARKLAAPRIAAQSIPVVWADDAHCLSLADRSIDCVLTTMTLCTVSNPAAVLAECRRVLKTDGTLHVLEHGRSTDPAIAARQDRVNDLRRPFVGGCNVNRDLESEIVVAGFRFVEFDRLKLGRVKAMVATIVGVGRLDPDETDESSWKEVVAL